ncbi:DNA repair protein RecO [Corynebacterium sp. HMSC06C06]|uniref:DNA repair protein RecO n=1 Tax=Corynebacterium TaxID=1716 RepID=UPI0008A2AAE5|nr:MULTISPECIES: DNA repair protein RecO [Corynebacterium]MDK7884314.1 DNA repair protein RecO [Corynebacterium striatum]OFT50106.1 DNA repair protein RecO [Corynebacterium sp. HMSC06C06]
MARENFRDRALVIRSYDFGEADRVIVLLTRNHGLVRGVAKGVRRAKSRFGSRLQLFVNLDVQLYPGRNLYTISQADTVDYFGANIIEDYERYTAACAALESAERLAFTDADSDPYLYTALVHTLQVMQHDDPLQALDAFLLQAMAHAGWAPSLFDCAQCQKPGPHHAFHPAVGGAACHECRPPGAAEVDPETLHHMWLLAHGCPSNPAHEQRQEAHQLTRAHLQWHLERKVTALGVMDQ